MLGHGSGFDSPGWNELRRVFPRLGQAFHAKRRDAGLSLVDLYVKGRDHEDLYQVAEALLELDEQAQLWRMRHYQVVARVIGDSVVGTQGTPVELLGRLVTKTSFPGALGGPERADRALEGGALAVAIETWSLRAEATTLLQDLLRVDTVNPPGNETLAAEVLVDYLPAGRPLERAHRTRSRAGEPRGADPRWRRPVARIPEPYGHRARGIPAEWDRDPWSGDLVDGEIWGRGALDMKGQVAASAVAFASLAREGFTPSGDPPCSSSSRTRRWARGSGSAGSWRRIPTRRAAITPSTRAAEIGSCSAGGPSTCARPRRRCRLRSASACTVAAATRRCRASPTTARQGGEVHRPRLLHSTRRG